MANCRTLFSHLLCDERYKKSCLQPVYIPCHDNLLLKSLLISSPLPFSVDFADVYAQANPWKQQWVSEREVIHGAARGRASERGSREEHSRIVSRDFPRLPQMESLLTSYKCSWTHTDYLAFSESVSTNDDLDCSYPWSLLVSPPPKKKCVHVGVLSQSFESGTSLFMSKRSFFAFNFQAVRAMWVKRIYTRFAFRSIMFLLFFVK